MVAILACSSEGTPTKSPTSITQEPISQEWRGVHLGMCADEVLKIHPKSDTIGEPENLGTDANGLVVKWNYSEASLIFAKRQGQYGITCYRVQEIQLKK